ncbi:MAG: DUF1294 domain-containing protein [Lachnospiraceae bacterium]|nr:DUF1294 domain-containing protein [Lachnospiraceae bacterium]
MNPITFLIIYFVIMNIVGFAIMGIDKRKAIKRTFRIPEATLFIVALIGGSIGSILGMRVFRHKTRHWYFVIGMPAILILQIALLVFLLTGPIEFFTL